MTPNILVVGAGWYGCYIAYMLKNTGYSVRIIEKESEIMTQTSTHNQNRLHFGFHYMRSFHTRDECLRGYDTFMNDFSFLTRPVPCNLYIVHKKSLLDTETIHQILDLHRIPYDNYPLEYVQSYLHLDNIQDILLTHERIIDPFLSKQFFEQELKDILWCECDYEKYLSSTHILSYPGHQPLKIMFLKIESKAVVLNNVFPWFINAIFPFLTKD